MRKRPIIGLKVLPGEPTDGTGKVCIHLVVPDPKGPFEEPCIMAMEEVEGQYKRLITKPMRCRLACNPKRLVAPVEKNGVRWVTIRVTHAPSVTCPKCKLSEDYNRIMKERHTTQTTETVTNPEV